MPKPDRCALPLALLTLLLLPPAYAEQTERYDYFSANRNTIRNGVQAVLTCNGLFTSQRTLEQVFAQELAYLPDPVGTADGGDLARFGLLYLQNGVWDGERLLSEDWIEFVRTPAPATAKTGNFYDGQWWLVPDDRDDVPLDAYSTAGNRGQYVIVVPSHDVVIVRRGLDYGSQGFDKWDLTREVLKAIAAD